MGIFYYQIFQQSAQNFAKNTAVIHYLNGNFFLHTYEDLYVISDNIYNIVRDDLHAGQCIGIITDVSPIVPILTALIHRCQCSFIFLRPNEQEINQSIINHLNISLIFTTSCATEKMYDNFISKNLSNNITNVNSELYLLKNHFIKNKFLQENISYIVRTSGSTGIPKYVTVPDECITPNILDFEKIFCVSSEDVLYFSTPLTFDPSIVELFLAAKCGAALMIAPQDLSVIFENKYKITIWQTTPSKFITLGYENIVKHILCENTSLRVLALGGEPLTYSFNNMKDPNNSTQIYSLYGITEVSCWASIEKIGRNHNENLLSLGESLSQTLMEIYNDKNEQVQNELGHIFIGSSIRKCLISDDISSNNKNSFSTCTKSTQEIVWCDSGDLGIKIENKIYFKGRKNRAIKRFGHKINLLNVESKTMSFEGVRQCACIWDVLKNLLILFFSSDTLTKNDILKFLNKSVDSYSMPDVIIQLKELPVNNHGKLSFSELNDIYTDLKKNVPEISNSKDLFVYILKESLSLPDIKTLIFEDKSFFDIGGSSIMAMQIANKFEMSSGNIFSDFYTSLLDSKCPLRKIIEQLEELNFQKPLANMKRQHDFTLSETLSMKKIITSKSFTVKILWKYDTKKCVDGNPVVTSLSGKMCIFIGSHSGLVVVLDGFTGSVIFQFHVNSRVEAPGLCFQIEEELLAIVGCYDGVLWCFSVTHDDVRWKISLKNMIKSQCALIKSFIYAATYDSILYKINIMGIICNYIEVGSKGITADLAVDDIYIFVAALDGTCCKINSQDCTILWKNKLNSPIFAKPTLIKSGSQIIFNEVSGKIHCFDANSGEKIWIFEGFSRLIFSSCSVRSDEIALGCHDRRTYELTVANTEPRVVWRHTHSSEVYATPAIFADSHVVSISTDGNLRIIDMSTGETAGEYSLPGEAFSSPAIKGNRVFVGCRDDHVYCLKIE